VGSVNAPVSIEDDLPPVAAPTIRIQLYASARLATPIALVAPNLAPLR